MKTSTWKAVERKVASFLQEKWHGDSASMIARVPVTGRGRGSAPDIMHPWYSIEVKHRQKLPVWLKKQVDESHFMRSVKSNPGVLIGPLRKIGEGPVGTFEIERQLPKEFVEAMDQAVASMQDGHEECLIVLHEHRMKIEDSIAIVLQEQFIRKFKESKEGLVIGYQAVYSMQ